MSSIFHDLENCSVSQWFQVEVKSGVHSFTGVAGQWLIARWLWSGSVKLTLKHLVVSWLSESQSCLASVSVNGLVDSCVCLSAQTVVCCNICVLCPLGSPRTAVQVACLNWWNALNFGCHSEWMMLSGVHASFDLSSLYLLRPSTLCTPQIPTRAGNWWLSSAFGLSSQVPFWHMYINRWFNVELNLYE